MASASDDGEGPASLLQGGEAFPFPTPPPQECNLEVGLTVTPDVVVTVNPSCETTGRPGTLTFRYTGGGCDASDNAATNCGDKASTCEGSIDDTLEVVISASGKKAEYTIDNVLVAPGGIFTISAIKFDAWTTITLTNSVEECNRIHTSCSAPLVVGDVFGSITLTGINGQEAESVEITYTVTNVGDDLCDVKLDGSPFDHHVDVTPDPLTIADGSQQYTFIQPITGPTSFTVTASGVLADGQDYRASDSKDIELAPVNTRMPSRKSKKGSKGNSNSLQPYCAA